MGKNIQILRILYLIFVVIASVSQAVQMYMEENLKHQDVVVFKGNLNQIKTRSLLACANMCIGTKSCMSLFYHSQSSDCVLHKFLGAHLKLQKINTVMSDGWKYYENLDGSRGEECVNSDFLYNSTVDVCYMLKTATLDFDIMKQVCANTSSELIKITSKEKHDWIVSVVESTANNYVGIQGNMDNVNSQYQFYDGTPMTFFNWDKGQPNGEPQRYILLRKLSNYLWHDNEKTYSTKQALTVCEK